MQNPKVFSAYVKPLNEGFSKKVIFRAEDFNDALFKLQESFPKDSHKVLSIIEEDMLII